MSRLHEQNEFLATHHSECIKENGHMTSLREGRKPQCFLGYAFILHPRGRGRREALGQGLGGEGVRRRY